MSLSEKEVEALKAGGPGWCGYESFDALCDLALAGLRGNEDAENALSRGVWAIVRLVEERPDIMNSKAWDAVSDFVHTNSSAVAAIDAARKERAMSDRRPVVLAGSYAEFRDWCRDTGTDPNFAIYANSDETIMGLHIHPKDVIKTGRYWLSKVDPLVLQSRMLGASDE